MTAHSASPPNFDFTSSLRLPVRRALLSVSDKSGLESLAKDLHELGVEILSTGGTARSISEWNIPVVDVATYTGSPEVMGGRVKTLHPRVHGGILMRDTDTDRAELQSLGGTPIDLVVVNLYPFEQTVARGAPYPEVVENIDIGGPSMLRSAAKNHARVVVLVDPSDYGWVQAALKNGGLTFGERQQLAAKAFAHTSKYDLAIAAELSKYEGDGSVKTFPRYFGLAVERGYELRYGENPHQSAAYYKESSPPAGSLASAQSLGTGAKELSFNNFVDAEAALLAVSEHHAPTAVVIKHTNPCGVATRHSIEDAYLAARDADALSAFGGIVALNRPVTKGLATLLAETFLECVIAPSFEGDALPVLHSKKNLRLLATETMPTLTKTSFDLKRIGGGLLVQSVDATAEADILSAKLVSKVAASKEQTDDLLFAWRVCKHVKSNAIVLASNQTTVGVGAGQMSRVKSVEIAIDKAQEKVRGAVLASDAFFPFPDGVEIAARAGVVAIVQPGGSVKDAEVIKAADDLGIAMIFTGARHFRH